MLLIFLSDILLITGFQPQFTPAKAGAGMTRFLAVIPVKTGIQKKSLTYFIKVA
jgi:hypothetical protein